MKFRKLLSAAILFFAAFFVRGVEVVNAGHSGWNSRQLREIFRQELDKNRPDLIILMVGTNDNLNSYNLVPPEEFEKNLTAMAEAARASGAELLLCEIPNACQELMQKRHKADFFRRETAEDKVRRANQIAAAGAEAQRSRRVAPLFRGKRSFFSVLDRPVGRFFAVIIAPRKIIVKRR